MSNLEPLTRFSPQMLDIIQTGAISISGFLVNSLMNKICHNSRTSNDTEMNLRPLYKIEKKIHTLDPKVFDDEVMVTNHDVIVFFPL